MSRYVAKGATFRFKGVANVEDCVTSEDVMRKAGLDWEVGKCRVYAEIPCDNVENCEMGFYRYGNNYVEFDNAFATYRKDCNIPLGIVKERYTPVQNIEAFKFFDGAIGKDKAIWQTAGNFDNGKRVFVSAKLPKNIYVNNDVVENYLLFTTTHDGSSGVRILFTPIRVVCQNTLNAAIKCSSNYVSFRHTASVHDNLDCAAEILGICDKKIDVFGQAMNYMSKIQCDDTKAREYFAKTVLTQSELDNIKATGHNVHQIIFRDVYAINDANISMKKVNLLSEMNNYYFEGIGQKDFVGTNYGVYAAITGYYSNVDNSKGAIRMDSMLFGDKNKKLEYATNLLLNE